MTSQVVVDASDTTFQQDVIERSRHVPVVVDFWAPWCGPCRTLGPLIERVAAESGGAVQLVKVNIDENPGVATTFGIQSIPNVIAFRDGAPAAQFVGAQPEPAVRQFFQGLVPTQADRLAEQGARALGAGDLDAARAAFEQALGVDAEHRGASIGLAAILLETGDLDRAEELSARWPRDVNAKRILGHVHFRRAAGGADRAALEARLAADDNDADAHYRLGALLALDGEWEPALEHLLTTVMLDRKLDDDGGRLRMLDAFSLMGDDHELTQEFRRRLANVLF